MRHDLKVIAQRVDAVNKALDELLSRVSTAERSAEIRDYFDAVQAIVEGFDKDEIELREEIERESAVIAGRPHEYENSFEGWFERHAMEKERLLHEHGLKTIDEIMAERYKT